MLRAATAAAPVIENVDNSRCLGSKSQAHTCKRAGQTLGFACRFDSQPRPLAQDHAREALGGLGLGVRGPAGTLARTSR